MSASSAAEAAATPLPAEAVPASAGLASVLAARAAAAAPKAAAGRHGGPVVAGCEDPLREPGAGRSAAVPPRRRSAALCGEAAAAAKAKAARTQRGGRPCDVRRQQPVVGGGCRTNDINRDCDDETRFFLFWN